MALDDGMYQLVAELLRFIVPPVDSGSGGRGSDPSSSRPGSANRPGSGGLGISSLDGGKLGGSLGASRPSSRAGKVAGRGGEAETPGPARVWSQQTAPYFWLNGWFRGTTPPEEIQRQTSSGAVLPPALRCSLFVYFTYVYHRYLCLFAEWEVPTS
jgi:hypothetical protein